jgi:NhaC family Na+:H+ antiporter
VPVIVIGLIIRKNRTLNCFIIWNVIRVLFQPHIINQIAGVEQMTFQSAYKGYGRHNRKSSHPTDNETLAALLLFGGMQKNARHNLVDYLRYGFGGIMDAIGALSNK